MLHFQLIFIALSIHSFVILKWEIVRVTCNLKISQGKLRDEFSIHSFSFVEFKEEETPLITKKGVEGQKEKKENKSAMHLIFWPQRDRD